MTVRVDLDAYFTDDTGDVVLRGIEHEGLSRRLGNVSMGVVLAQHVDAPVQERCGATQGNRAGNIHAHPERVRVGCAGLLEE